MWDRLDGTGIEVPTVLSSTAYVRPSGEKTEIVATVTFEKQDPPPTGEPRLDLGAYSPDHIKLLQSEYPSFDYETFYYLPCRISLNVGAEHIALADGLDVFIPIKLSTHISYNAQDSLINHAGPTWDWVHGSFGHSFRQLNESTKEYQNLDIDSIERVLHSEAQRTGESFEFAGIKFPAEGAAIWGTVVILAIQIYLWIHLRQLSPKLQPNDPGWDVAWIGVYTSCDAKFAMFLTTVVLPIVVLLGLGTRWFSLPLEINWLLLAVTVPLSSLFGVCTWRIRPRVGAK